MVERKAKVAEPKASEPKVQVPEAIAAPISHKPKAHPVTIAEEKAIQPMEPVVIIAGPENEPRYEEVAPTTVHKMIEDPETHVRHCKFCHAPEWHAQQNDACAPRSDA